MQPGTSERRCIVSWFPSDMDTMLHPLLLKCTFTRPFVKFAKGIKFKRTFKYKPKTNILKMKVNAQLPDFP